MTVILVTQETGSRGDEVAAGIAACLGLELVTREQIEQRVAERLQISEFTLRRLLHGTASVVERWTIGRRRLVRCMAGEVVSFAGRGNVVVQSWGRTALRRRVRHAICVHVWASREQDTPRPKIPLCYKAQPGTRSSWIGAKCGDPDSYDLVFDTKRTLVEECVGEVRRLAQTSQLLPTSTSHGALASVVRENRIRKAPVLEVEVARDRITLPIATSGEEAIARVERHLRGKKDHGDLAGLGSWPATRLGIL